MKELLEAIEEVRKSDALEEEDTYTCHLMDESVAGDVQDYIIDAGDEYAGLLEKRMGLANGKLRDSFVTAIVHHTLGYTPRVHPLYREERLKWLDFLEAKILEELDK